MKHFILIIFSSIGLTSAMQCKSPDGENVDWFIIYKLPRDIDEKYEKGSEYFYMDNNSQKWSLSSFPVDSHDRNPLYNSLKEIYNAQSIHDIDFLMYNDGLPEGGDYIDTYGHSKGVVAFGSDSGFWLIHSLPRYPLRKKDGYEYVKNGYKYGQTFLCVTYPRNMLEKIETQLRYINPHIYDGNFKVKDKVDADIQNKLTILKSKGNNEIYHFAKSANYGQDLYQCFVTKELKTNMMVQSWNPEQEIMDPDCDESSEFKVTDITGIAFQNGDIKFNSRNDHSKWTTSVDNFNTGYWTCIGDINRMDEQKQRDGGTACINNKNIWRAFNDIIEQDNIINRDRRNMEL